MSITYKNSEIGDRDSFVDSFVLTAVRIEALTERYLFKPVGISSASFKILVFVRKHPNCSPSQIMDYIGGTKSNITQRLNFLERSKLILSARSKEGDKRKLLVSLSPEGTKKIKEVMDVFKKKSIFLEKFFTDKELAEHFSFMRKMNKVLNECEQLILKKNCKCKVTN